MRGGILFMHADGILESVACMCVCMYVCISPSCSVLLRQNPHNVHEWLKRVKLFDNKPHEVRVFLSSGALCQCLWHIIM